MNGAPIMGTAVQKVGSGRSDRILGYARSPVGRRFPASVPVLATDGRIYGTWIMGNNYRRTSELYGSYPPGYLDRILALFADVPRDRILHLYAGSVPEDAWTRLDIMSDATRHPDVQGSAADLERLFLPGSFDLVLADPPYAPEDARRYGTPMPPHPRLVFDGLHGVVADGGHVAWMDTRHPQNRKDQWELAGAITVIRSSNHRYRVVSLWERQ